MSVKSEMSYWVVCDGCGARPEFDGYELLYRDEDEAVLMALDRDWYRVRDTEHACGSCVSFDDDGESVLRVPVTGKEEQA